MKQKFLLFTTLIGLLLSATVLSAFILRSEANETPVVAMHLLNFEDDEELLKLEQELPAFKAKGINLLFLEVDYHFDFKTHPELRSSKFISAPAAKRFSNACKTNGIKVIPQFQSVGHQSWAENTWSLLTTYPELDLTPGAFPGNKNIYCREWDITNPKVNEIVFPMMDEIIAAFQADGIHIGMDEIFLIGAKESPNTYGKDVAQLFAKVINEFHDHFVKEKHLTLYMWGDRLIDANKYSYGEWEASTTGSAAAITMIPTDIVICDWHYSVRNEYGSIPMFLEHGFKVIPCSYTNPEATKSLVKYSFRLGSPGVIGHCFTSWSSVPNDSLLIYPAFTLGLKTMQEKLFWDVSIKEKALHDGSVTIEMNADQTGAAVYYTLDGSEPGPSTHLYKGPFTISATSNIKAQAFVDNKPIGEVSGNFFDVHLGTGKNVTLTPAPSIKYKPNMGAQTLVNSITGGPSFGDGEWVGIEGQEITVVIDLGKRTPVRGVSFNSYHKPDSWILGVKNFKVQVSNDNVNFQPPEHYRSGNREQAYYFANVSAWEEPIEARYIKLTIPKHLLPAGHAGAGTAAWVFIDEVIVK